MTPNHPINDWSMSQLFAIPFAATTDASGQNKHFPTDRTNLIPQPKLDEVDRKAFTCSLSTTVIITCAVLALVWCCDWINSSPAEFQKTFVSNFGEDKGKQPHVIELVYFKLRKDANVEDFLRHAKALRPFFASTRDALQRSLVYNMATNEWADIVYWTTMSAALKAAKDIQIAPVSQPFLKLLNTSTIHLTHSTIRLDWRPFQKSKVAEIAAFPLVKGVSDSEFVEDARALSPFFAQSKTAKHRILAQGDDKLTWYDIVYWTSVEKAKKAAARIEHFRPARPFLNAINSSTQSYKFQYYQVILWQDF